jgi:ubiquinone/menaquinone biosynthesis C-methylase UbiE
MRNLLMEGEMKRGLDFVLDEEEPLSLSSSAECDSLNGNQEDPMRTKGYKGLGMEGRVAKWYAKNTRKDMGEFKALAMRMSANLPAVASVLEVAPGPGYFSIELAKLGNCRITGLDISKTFVELARKNAREEGVDVDFRQGNASHTPFADDSFDLIVCRAAFKNFSEPVAALKEMRRVLRPGGKALVIDLRRDAPKETIDEYVDKMNIGAVNAVVTKLTFRLLLLKRAYMRDEFERFIAKSGFEKIDIQETPIGFEITLLK